MQYTTEYLTTTIHHHTELAFERDLERRRIARERAEEQRAPVRMSIATVFTARMPAIRMLLAGLLRSLRPTGAGSGPDAEMGAGAAPALDAAAPDGAPLGLPAAASYLSETTERQPHRELAHR